MVLTQTLKRSLGEMLSKASVVLLNTVACCVAHATRYPAALGTGSQLRFSISLPGTLYRLVVYLRFAGASQGADLPLADGLRVESVRLPAASTNTAWMS